MTTRPSTLGASARILVLAAALACTACQSTSTPAPSFPVDTSGPGAVVLASGDSVSVSFQGSPDLNVSQKIRADGKISLPIIGEAQAAGKTVSSLQNHVAERYATQLKDTTVTVRLDSTIQAVYVSGAVNSPGKIVLDRPMTALEAIMEAGGFQAGWANPRKVRLIRMNDGRHETSVLDLSPTTRGQAGDAIYLRPYDMLTVPDRWY
jgi:polysaccharide export outer membrane protein